MIFIKDLYEDLTPMAERAARPITRIATARAYPARTNQRPPNLLVAAQLQQMITVIA